MTTQVFRQCA